MTTMPWDASQCQHPWTIMHEDCGEERCAACNRVVEKGEPYYTPLKYFASCTECCFFVKKGDVIQVEPNFIEQRPMFDINGEKVVNPFTYQVCQALASLTLKLTTVPMQPGMEFSIHVSVKCEKEAYWAVAKVYDKPQKAGGDEPAAAE